MRLRPHICAGWYEKPASRAWAKKGVCCCDKSRVPAAMVCSMGFQTWDESRSSSVILGVACWCWRRLRRPSVEASSRPASPPPTMTIRWACCAMKRNSFCVQAAYRNAASRGGGSHGAVIQRPGALFRRSWRAGFWGASVRCTVWVVGAMWAFFAQPCAAVCAGLGSVDDIGVLAIEP